MLLQWQLTYAVLLVHSSLIFTSSPSQQVQSPTPFSPLNSIMAWETWLNRPWKTFEKGFHNLRLDESSKCYGGRKRNSCRSSNLTVNHEGWRQWLWHMVISHCKSQWLAPLKSATNVHRVLGQVSSCVLNDPVDDMWCDVLWVDMAKLTQNATTV